MITQFSTPVQDNWLSSSVILRDRCPRDLLTGAARVRLLRDLHTHSDTPLLGPGTDTDLIVQS